MLSYGEFLGPYEVIGMLGAGGMGEVYKARDTRLGRFVALKVLRAETSQRADLRERLRNEAKSIARLNHPFICTLYDVGVTEGLDYLVMEYVEGQTLASVLRKVRVPLETAITYAVSIADALKAAHDAGVLHRDLKPANLMITPEGKVKVLDFGIAKRLPVADSDKTCTVDITADGSFAGTLAYSAPEVLRGFPADARSDIWAFGATLHEMVSGEPLFKGQTAAEIVCAVLERPVTPPPSDLPKALYTIIHRCLERDPANRFHDGGEVVTALASAVWESARRQGQTSPQGQARRGRNLTRQRSEASQTRVSTGVPGSPVSDANEYFEKGILFIWARPDLPRARDMLQKALALDSSFAEAKAAYGFTNWGMIEQGYSCETSWLYDAEELLYEALELNPDSALARYALAAVYLYQGRKELVPAEVERALRAKPPRPAAVHWLAHYHRLNGDYDAASKVWTQLMRQDPLFWPARMNFADVLLQTGQHEQAVREYQKFLEQAPENIFAVRGLSRAYISLNHVDNARTILDRVRPEDRQNYHIRMATLMLAALEGRRDEAEQGIDDELLRFAGANALRAFEAVELYSLLGRSAKALEWLDRTLRGGDERIDWFHRDPLLASIQDDARFTRMLASVKRRRAQTSTAGRRRTGNNL